jgi:hypothetical protein
MNFQRALGAVRFVAPAGLGITGGIHEDKRHAADSE